MLAPSAPTTSFRPFRFAMRELRGGLRGFYVFIFCIALGVMTIAGVGSFSRSLTNGLAREGRVILGGDVSFSLTHREATNNERAFLERQGQVSAAATMRAMSRTAGGQLALVELKAVDGAYPLYGSVELEDGKPLAETIAKRGDAFGAAVDPALLARLDLKPGARLTIGSATIEITGVIKSEPDKLAAGIAFGPRVIVSVDALRVTDLLQPGSLVRWNYRLRLPESTDSAAEAAVKRANAQMPDAGWEIRTRNNASPALERNVERFTQFLTLVGLTALLVGGVGVANAVKSHLDRKREVIATMKSLGATGGRVFAIYLSQVLVLAAAGSVIGLAVGAMLPFAIAATFGKVLPLPVAPALHAGELMLAFVYGLLTALAFALWPLGRAHDVPVSALFRDQIAQERGRRRWPRRRYVIATAVAVAAVATI
jgi:putative ABC transport system permease protein